MPHHGSEGASRNTLVLPSSFKVKGQIYTVADTDFILGMHVQHIKVHIFRGDLSRSSFKVKFTK